MEKKDGNSYNGVISGLGLGLGFGYQQPGTWNSFVKVFRPLDHAATAAYSQSLSMQRLCMGVGCSGFRVSGRKKESMRTP